MQRLRAPGSKWIPALVAISLLACGGGERAGEGSSTEPEVSGRQVYSVRGMVRRLPGGGESPREVWIFHEEIREFVDINGRVAGMQAMTMPFTVAEGVDLGGLEPGDKISFVLEVDWEGSPPSQILEIRKLDAATRLDFEAPPQ